MKKLALTIAIVLAMSFGAYAQRGSGMFQYGMVSDEEFYGAGYGLYYDDDFGLRTTGVVMPNLPIHGETGNQNAPLGGGALLLVGFGAAYALKKRSEK